MAETETVNAFTYIAEIMIGAQYAGIALIIGFALLASCFFFKKYWTIRVIAGLLLIIAAATIMGWLSLGGSQGGL